MSKEILKRKTCKELRDLAKELEITGRWEMNKDQLIDAIIAKKQVDTILGAKEVKNTDENKSAKDEYKVDNQNDVETESKNENKSVNIDMAQKMQYIENIKIGTLVAFRLSNGKVKSAKVTRKSTNSRKLKLETNYGAEYIISFDDVLWVRSGKRWPKGIYNLLKGLVDEDGKNE